VRLTRAARGESHELKRILAAVDGSPYADRAAEVAIELARKSQAELTFLNIVPAQITPTSEFKAELTAYSAAAVDQGKAIVESLAKRADGVKVKTAVVSKASSTVNEIIKFAKKEDVGLIIIGTRGRGGFERQLLGSVSNGVLNHAHCSVMVVR
jgi:nucleotide-binding universal stress UspA family protein